MSDDTETHFEPPNIAAGYERRLGKLSAHIKALRTELEQKDARIATLTTSGTDSTTKLVQLKTDHKSALEKLTGEHAGVLQRMERAASLTAAGVEADGHDTVLTAYAAVGEGAPPLADWLKSEGLPKHVSCYLAQPESGDGKPAAHNPDAGTGGRAGNVNGTTPGFLASATPEDLRAMKEQGLI